MNLEEPVGGPFALPPCKPASPPIDLKNGDPTMYRSLQASRSVHLLLTILLAAALFGTAACGPANDEPGPVIPEEATDVPYSIALETFGIDGYPGLHSFAIAGNADQVVLLAGRTNGLHGFAPSRQAAEFPSFPEEYANNVVYVLDLVQKSLLGSAKIDDLPAPYVQQLKASNTEYLLQDGFLYIVGGYGEQPPSSAEPGGGLITLPFLTAIDFDALVTTITSGGALDATFAAAHMANFQHPALAITGGDIQPLGDLFLLLYGHRFDGEYSLGGGQAFQEYSNSVRVFAVSASNGGGSVTLSVDYKGSDPTITSGMDPDNPFHRRDLPIKLAQAADGSPRIGVYGGVFKGGRMEGYVNPIYVTADSSATLGIAVNVDTTASQLLSQYDCPALQLYSASRSSMYSTFFGGMSYYYWDAANQCLKHDTVDLNKFVDGLPFIDSVSTLRVDTTGTQQFLHTGASFAPAGGIPQCAGENTDGTPVTVDAPYLGSESKFVPVAGLPQHNGVLQLDQLSGPTVIGYLIGGIASNSPYGSNPNDGVTCASNRVYQVTLDPATATSTIEPQLCPELADGAEG